MNKKNTRHSPAQGEINAISGYRFQYQIASALILKSLKDRSLYWVKFVDHSAETLDDIQLNINGTIHAYQVKLCQSSGYITFKGLTSSSSGTSIIRQLSEGWKKLKSNNDSTNIVVHFLTNQLPSISDNIEGYGGNNGHLKSFLEMEWPTKDKEVFDLNYVKKLRPWDIIKNETQLNGDDFFPFY